MWPVDMEHKKTQKPFHSFWCQASFQCHKQNRSFNYHIQNRQDFLFLYINNKQNFFMTCKERKYYVTPNKTVLYQLQNVTELIYHFDRFAIM